MSTELVEIKADESTVLSHYHVTKEAAIALAEKYSSVSIAGLSDTKGYKAANEGRLELKKVRVEIEKKRKELKDGALKFGRLVDDAAKALRKPIEDAEDRLAGMIEGVDNEKERIKREQIESRLRKLADVGHVAIASDVERMTPEAFDKLLSEQKEIHEAKRKAEEEERERQRLEQLRLEEERKKEDERLRLEREELDRIRKEQEEREAAERARLAEIEAKQRAEREAIEAEKRKLELEQARREAAERARQEAEAKAKRDADEAERVRIEQARRQQEIAEQAERERQRRESMRPNSDKLLSVANAVAAIEVPKVDDAANTERLRVLELLAECEQRIRDVANQLA